MTSAGAALVLDSARPDTVPSPPSGGEDQGEGVQKQSVIILSLAISLEGDGGYGWTLDGCSEISIKVSLMAGSGLHVAYSGSAI